MIDRDRDVDKSIEGSAARWPRRDDEDELLVPTQVFMS